MALSFPVTFGVQSHVATTLQYGVTNQKTTTCIFIAVRTSYIYEVRP